MKKSILIIGLVILTVLIISILMAGVANAAAPPETQTTHRVSLLLRDSNKPDTKLITARLYDGDQPLGNMPVDFYVSADFFGSRPAKLDTVITNATGSASLIYEPRWNGVHTITVRCDEYPSVQATQSFNFTATVPQYVPQPVGLEPVRRVAPLTVPIVVLAVWALLLFITLRTIRGISRLSQITSKGGLDTARHNVSEKTRIAQEMDL